MNQIVTHKQGQIQRGLRGRGGRGARAPLDLYGEKEIVEGETGRGRRVGGWRRKKKMSPSKFSHPPLLISCGVWATPSL